MYIDINAEILSITLSGFYFSDRVWRHERIRRMIADYEESIKYLLTVFVIFGPSANTTQTTIDNAIIVRIILNDFDDLMQTKIEQKWIK